MKFMCECMNAECRLMVVIPTAKYNSLSAKFQVVIVDGCKHGPEPTDTFVSAEEGYTVYQEQFS